MYIKQEDSYNLHNEGYDIISRYSIYTGTYTENNCITAVVKLNIRNIFNRDKKREKKKIVVIILISKQNEMKDVK